MLSCFNSHWTSRLNKTDRGIIWVCVQQPQAYWNIICITWEKRRNLNYSTFTIFFRSIIYEVERNKHHHYCPQKRYLYLKFKLFLGVLVCKPHLEGESADCLLLDKFFWLNLTFAAWLLSFQLKAWLGKGKGGKWQTHSLPKPASTLQR